MPPYPAVSTSELILTLVAIRLAAVVAVCLIALAMPPRAHRAQVACNALAFGAVPAPEATGEADEMIRDMRRHD